MRVDGPVDVWAVHGVGEEQLVTAGTGFCCYPAPISPGQLTLAERAPAAAVPAGRRGGKTKQRKKTPRTRAGRGGGYRMR